MKDALVIILYDHPREHTTDYAQQTADYIAKRNFVVCYQENNAKSIKEIVSEGHWYRIWEKYRKNIFFYTPIYIIPFRRFGLVVRLNCWINSVLLKLIINFSTPRPIFTKKIVWLFYPKYASIIRGFGPSYSSIYDCIDYHSEEQYTVEETLLIKTSTLVTVNSHVLYELHHKIRKDIHLVPLGFALNRFRGKRKRMIIRLSY